MVLNGSSVFVYFLSKGDSFESSFVVTSHTPICAILCRVCSPQIVLLVIQSVSIDVVCDAIFVPTKNLPVHPYHSVNS